MSLPTSHGRTFVREKSGAEEELFHLVAQPLGQIADILAAICDLRVCHGDGDETVVTLTAFLGVLLQAKDADETTLDDDARKRRRIREHKDVEWVSVLATGAGQESPAVRIRET